MPYYRFPNGTKSPVTSKIEPYVITKEGFELQISSKLWILISIIALFAVVAGSIYIIRKRKNQRKQDFGFRFY